MITSYISEEEVNFQKPTEDEIKKNINKTKSALELLVSKKVAGALPVRHAEKIGAPEYLRYTPLQQGDHFNSGSSQRLIRMVEVQRDPLEPPRFKINKKIPQAPPSPPPAIMHSPPRKITVKEQQEWKIPPCISNWKNSKGYTIPLDKRLAADGRDLEQVHVNERFAKFAEALYIAERKSREDIELRAQMERKRAQKEKEEKEEKLRKLAQKAREERAGIRSFVDEEDEVKKERDQIRHERNKERQREKNLQRAGHERRSKIERERDISEEIALGLANPKSNINEVQFDQRLFNQNKGINSGFGDEDDYAVYDKPWRSQNNISSNLYRPSNKDEDDCEENLDTLASTSRFVPEKGFSGVDKNVKRTGPVAFEKETEDEDPFGLDKFLTEAKKASKQNHHKKKKDH